MENKLDKYNKKRNFNKTSEPSGEIKKSNKKLRFVIQHHMSSKEHYDFRLEWDGTLKSWAVPKGPSYNTNDKRLAVQVEDHPLNYRNFEGTIPKGQYGGGTVMIWDEGFWEPFDNFDDALTKGVLEFILNGERLKGRWKLVLMKDNNWLLIKGKDEFVKDNYNIDKFTNSIRSNLTMKQIEKKS